MKHLLCEHQNTISELKAEGLVSTEVLQNEQEQLEAELHKEMEAIMVDMQRLDDEKIFRELEMVCSGDYTACEFRVSVHLNARQHLSTGLCLNRNMTRK